MAPRYEGGAFRGQTEAPARALVGNYGVSWPSEWHATFAHVGLGVLGGRPSWRVGGPGQALRRVRVTPRWPAPIEWLVTAWRQPVQRTRQRLITRRR